MTNKTSNPTHKSKYLITMSLRWIDYDNLPYRLFSIEYETKDLEEANRKFQEIKRYKVNEAKEREDYADLPDKEVTDTGPSEKGEILRSESRAIGIIPWEKMMFTFDLIQIPADKEVDKNMFHSEDEWWNREVEEFFRERNKTKETPR
ncbi:MAG: hypothetical protein JSV17_04555 [Candidatus Aminicenantes bacterium]|nr:MAG: hypothetical protein JSV17_04555 [Candidatus Aminicenantes bacterium]